MASFDLQLTLPPGTVTHRSGSTLDLAFVTSNLAEAVVACNASFGHGSDHDAVDLWLDFEFTRVVVEARLLWREVDWDDFRKWLAEAILAAAILADSAVWDTTQALDDAFATLLTILKEVIERCVPMAKPSPFSKRWWTRELTEMRRILGRLQRRAKKRRASDEEKDAAQVHCRAYHKEIWHAKLSHWREWLEEATEQSVWIANRYASQDGAGGPSRVPTLRDGDTVAETPEDKIKVLCKTFFPAQPAVVLDDIVNTVYPEPLPPEPVTLEEVADFVAQLSPYKAPGPSIMRNIVLQKCDDILSPLLRRITQGPTYSAAQVPRSAA